MSLHFAVGVAAAIIMVMAAAGFRWPDGAFRRSLTASICAAVLPFVVALVAAPFLGEGAGLGVAIIMYTLSAAVLLAAISACLGAAVRRVRDHAGMIGKSKTLGLRKSD